MMEVVEAGGFPVYYKGQMVFVEAGRGADGYKGISTGKGGRFYGRISGLKKRPQEGRPRRGAPDLQDVRGGCLREGAVQEQAGERGAGCPWPERASAGSRHR